MIIIIFVSPACELNVYVLLLFSDSLSDSKFKLEERLSIAEERGSVLQADLDLSRNTVEEQWEELERFRHETGQMKAKIKVCTVCETSEGCLGVELCRYVFADLCVCDVFLCVDATKQLEINNVLKLLELEFPRTASYFGVNVI